MFMRQKTFKVRKDCSVKTLTLDRSFCFPSVTPRSHLEDNPALLLSETGHALGPKGSADAFRKLNFKIYAKKKKKILVKLKQQLVFVVVELLLQHFVKMECREKRLKQQKLIK